GYCIHYSECDLPGKWIPGEQESRAKPRSDVRLYCPVRLRHHDMFRMLTSLLLLVVATSSYSAEQPAGSAPPAQRAIALAQRGRCKEALPLLKNATQVTDKQLKYQSAMLMARCAMSLDQTQTAVEALLLLNREFPRDPDVLYTTTHYYSELASRASQQLAAMAPESPQAEELEAEAFESQNDWDKAAAEYNKILAQNPTQSSPCKLISTCYRQTPPDIISWQPLMRARDEKLRRTARWRCNATWQQKAHARNRADQPENW